MTKATILQDTRPTEGQYVVVYSYDGEIWSKVLRETPKAGTEAYELITQDEWDSIGMTFEEMFADVTILGYLTLEA